jgi:tetratricopeptide (TPR) repeat protein
MLLAVIMLLLDAGPAAARSPLLIARISGGEGEGAPRNEELRLSRINTEVRIHGWLAETRMTMTFANRTDRILAGDLYFPLPEGATVSGYALDINGVLVDGVVVEKDRGRQVFEKVVRQGTDPGLVEWVKGNNFKTRVFPIPARGSRTIMVRYLSGLVDKGGIPGYQLPLAFSKQVDEFRLRVEVVGSVSAPGVTGALPGFSFGPWRQSWVAETTLRDVAPVQTLTITLPAVNRHQVGLETAHDGQTWFTINDFPPLPAARPVGPPARVVILWDASGSRGELSHEREFEVLRGFFSRFTSSALDVELILFRNDAELPRRITVRNGDPEGLIAELRTVFYDGGTRMSAIAPAAGARLPDYYLLFTDGMSSFGVEEPASLPRPLYIFSDAPRTNHPFLRHLAMKSGGDYVNLANRDPREAATAVGAPAFSFLGAEYDPAELGDVTPGTPQPVRGRFMLAGRLLAERARITLTYGESGVVTHRVEYQLRKGEAVAGDTMAIFRAVQRIDELQAMPKKHQAEMVAIGKRYGLVTPGTSLLVLDTIGQYVEHRIEPPASLPALRREYGDIMARRGAEEERKKEDKFRYVLALWEKRVAWWEKDFDYPPGFRYEAESRKAALRSEISREEGAPRAMTAPPPPSPQPVAAGASLAAEALVAADRAPMKKAKKDGAGGGDDSSVPARISITPWDPDTPYLRQLKEASPERRLSLYRQLRQQYAASPAFYLDCADYFLKVEERTTALQVLSNIAELELENPALLRILAHRLAQLDLFDLAASLFEEVLTLRPEEPQSFRDLALVLARRAERGAANAGPEKRDTVVADYRRALELLTHVVMNHWDRFAEIEVIALMEANRIIPGAKRAGVAGIPLDPRLVRQLDVDLRIVLTWDADMTDLDLWVTEPSGEKAYYSHPLSTIGGSVSRDITVGYGPEEYLLRKGMDGTYRIEANYYGSRSPELAGTATLQAEIFTNYGRPDEQRRAITLRLNRNSETVRVGDVEFRRN